MKGPLISVIVPCYNVEQYLAKCVDSILSQTYKNLEILLVDDGSPDKCGEMCDEYAQIDTRVFVIHKENGGLSDARNVAIDIAKGEYITFIDSDDYVSVDYIELLYRLIVDNNAQMSVSGFLAYKEFTTPELIDEPIKTIVFGRYEAMNTMFYQRDFDNSAWAKMYHRSLFETGIRYPRGWIYEDLATTYKLMHHCKCVAFTNYKNYFYLLREKSIEGAPFKMIKFDCCKNVVQQLIEDKKMMPSDVQKAMNCRIVSFVFHVLLEIPKSELNLREQLFTIIKQYRYSVLFDHFAHNKAKFASLLSFISLSTVDVLSDWVKLRR